MALSALDRTFCLLWDFVIAHVPEAEVLGDLYQMLDVIGVAVNGLYGCCSMSDVVIPDFCTCAHHSSPTVECGRQDVGGESCVEGSDIPRKCHFVDTGKPD